MKQNVNETESNWRFRKNVKICLQNKIIVTDAAFKHLQGITIFIRV